MVIASSELPSPDRRPPLLPGGARFFGHLGRFRNDRAGWLLDVETKSHGIASAPVGLFLRKAKIVTSPDLANEVLSTKHASFSKALGLTVFLAPLLGEGLVTAKAEPHARARRLLAPAFSPKRMTGYAQTMAERAARFAAKLEPGETLDISEAMMQLTLEVVGKTLFDAELAGDAGAVGAALTTAMEVVVAQLSSLVPIPPKIPTPLNRRLHAAVGRLDEVVFRIIRTRRAERTDRGDVLSILLSASDENGAMSDREVRDETMTLFLAGHETTANALAWTFYLLARNPNVRAVMEAELDALGRDPTYDDLKTLPYTLAVFKESMRLYPPVFMLGRLALTDVAIGDFFVEKGSTVFLNILGIHRRADIWPDPERFDPERFLGDKEKQLPRCAYLPFGAGPRICIGNHFALTEGHLLLATIARRARFTLTENRAVEVEPLVTLRPKGGIPVRAELR